MRPREDLAFLHLADDIATLRQGDWSISVACKVCEILSRETRVYIEFTGEQIEEFCKDGQVHIELAQSGARFEAYALGLKVRYSQSSGITFLSQRVYPVQEPVRTQPNGPLASISFVVANGPELYLDREHVERQLRSITLRVDDWEIILSAVTMEHEAISREAAAQSPFTHSGSIRRQDGRLFEAEDSETVLDELAQFLSFVGGWWVGLGLVRGLDHSGTVRWQRWGFTRMQEPPDAKFSWYSWKMVDALEELFRCFVTLQRQELWREALATLLYWYSRSNSRAAGVDGSLILNQAAFELLAWQILVRQTGVLREEHFYALNAEGQLRVTLAQLGIPLAIPDRLQRLTRLAKAFNWSSNAQALVAIRNYLVHPVKKSGKTPAREYPYFEAWLLSQHLLELAILRLINYRGHYIDRTSQSAIQEPIPVPWALKSQDSAP